jgi:hypothetical protein
MQKICWKDHKHFITCFYVPLFKTRAQNSTICVHHSLRQIKNCTLEASYL